MLNEEILKINIVERISKNLGMNSSARALFEEINNSPANIIKIDFSNVLVMSRSFTQEYLSQKFYTDKQIIEVNVPNDVKLMFDVVKKDFNNVAVSE